MGCGSWTPHDWDSYSKSSIAGKSAAGIYTSKMMKAEFDPKDIPVRESRDSADHPSSNAIIIGLDVTGSIQVISVFVSFSIHYTSATVPISA